MSGDWGWARLPWLGYLALMPLALGVIGLGSYRRWQRLRKVLAGAELERWRLILRARLRALILVCFGLTLAICAGAGPYWGQRSAMLEAAGVNVIGVVDLSASMNARDYHPSRLEVAKLELSRLFEQLKGQRLGVVGFAGIPVTLLPLTGDYTAAKMAVEALDVSSIPVPGTAMGDGIRVALERLGRAGGVLVLLSDGEDYHSEPIQAARQAARRGVAIVCVGIGTEKGCQVPDWKDEKGADIRDAQGQVVTSCLDAKTLQEIASITGGRYFRLEAGNERNIEAVMSVVRSCQAREQARQEAKTRRDLTPWLLLVALICTGLGWWMYLDAAEVWRESK